MSLSPAASVSPARRLRGRLRVPGDKSIAHRYAILGALAEGRSTIANYAPGADCRSTLACLQALGIDVQHDSDPVTLLGRGIGRWCSPHRPLDAGNSGTTMRLLAGVLAGHAFSATITGDASLSRRPMRRVIEPLEAMGAHVDAADGRPPLTIHGRAPLHAIAHRPTTPSAQVKSAVLLAGLHADGTTRVTEPAATRDHTERALAAFGARVSNEDGDICVEGGQRLTAQALTVPGDFSSAAFWMVGAAALPGSRIELDDVGLNPTRSALLDVLRRFGARVEVEVTATHAGEPRGRVSVEGDRHGTLDIAAAEVPGLIDELPAIAALAAHGGEVSVHGASELRVKESDRIAALVAGFRALGIDADEREDGFTIHGSAGNSPRPHGGIADAHGDHRLAMAFAIAALAADGPSTIQGSDVVAISYPGFFETLRQLVADTE
jgi:3-phosphoshikimate 1-carboxyvinyltransferase